VEWVRYATFTQFYDRGHWHVALGHTWTLAVEAAFYLLLPLPARLALGSVWRPRRTVTILCAAGAVITGGWLAALATGRMDMGLHTMWLPAFAGFFAAGMAMATAHVAMENGRPSILAEVARSPLTCWALAFGVLVVAGTPLTGPRDLDEPSPGQFATKTVLFLVVAVAVVLPVAFARQGPVASTLSSPVAQWLGMVSYGLFLWHPFVLILLHPVMGTGGFPTMARTYLLTLGGALLLATLSWYGLEQPLQQLGRRRRSRAGAQTPASPARDGDTGPAESAGPGPAEVEGPRANGSVPSQSAAKAASPAS
jgi:peptidoglycan/LPS O-acetylase OafA/YrhL